MLVHFGLLWDKWRERYPRTEHHPPIGAVVELFGSKGPSRGVVTIESHFPLGRCWYLSEDDQRVIQVQQDRFTLNWRRTGADTPYPSYDALRDLFRKELEAFRSFIVEEKLGEFAPVQCELTYINHLPSGEGWSTANELAGVIAPWSGHTTGSHLPDVEAIRWTWQYRFDEDQEPCGRLHVEVRSALRKSDRHPLLAMHMIGRGAPIGEGSEGVLAFTDRAHEWIVKGFTALTTKSMHTLWERER